MNYVPNDQSLPVIRIPARRTPLRIGVCFELAVAAPQLEDLG